MLTRRNLLQTGAAAGLVTAASPVFATVAPPQPRINPGLLARAKAAMESKRRFLLDTNVIAVADYSQPSASERFYLVNLAGGMVTTYQVSHGRGSDPYHTGYLNYFSNEPGSEASSAGSYITGDVYYGKYGRSLRLKGLDWSNSNAEARAIVVHSAAYAEPRVVEQFGKLGRSEGCFALSQLSLQYVLQQLGPGRLLYSDKV
ncbi:MAG TPA: murein L,D-transpeptidase catalytic domain family protein [Allosphingosinicella sp.]|uniref:murein L,D-transpeptidase catalytic domain family protein n=1 Tax=Allosphingosinicella sp. TaxID=2823234 RepID=UPI002EDA09CA